MPTITLKNIPKDLHAALKARAARNGRSLNREAATCLEAAVSVSPVEVDQTLANVDRIRCGDETRLDEKLLRKALMEGRP